MATPNIPKHQTQQVKTTDETPWEDIDVPNSFADHVLVGKMETSDGVTFILVGFGADEYKARAGGVVSQRKLSSMTRLHEKRAASLLHGLIENLGDEVLENLGYVRK